MDCVTVGKYIFLSMEYSTRYKENEIVYPRKVFLSANLDLIKNNKFCSSRLILEKIYDKHKVELQRADPGRAQKYQGRIFLHNAQNGLLLFPLF